MDRKMVRVKLDDGAYLPTRAHLTDAGLDLRTMEDVTVPAHGFVFIDTGVHIEIPKGTRGHICSKSGLNRWHGLTADGTVDEGYTGTVGVTVHNSSGKPFSFVQGDSVAQIVIEPVMYPRAVQVDKISGGDRGDNGYGSTGR